MKELLELPDDVLIRVLHHFLRRSAVEDLIKLETVSKNFHALRVLHIYLLNVIYMYVIRFAGDLGGSVGLVFAGSTHWTT